MPTKAYKRERAEDAMENAMSAEALGIRTEAGEKKFKEVCRAIEFSALMPCVIFADLYVDDASKNRCRRADGA